MDGILGWLTTRAWRRGRGGEPVWLAVAAAAWLVRRTLRDRDAVVWRGEVAPGESLTVTTVAPE
ncbi:MAG TPA: hypothetical protein VE991_08065 [Acidimicrobiales bacterium]|nr:hypothetical protein [Acidimicrobiales bacterium]